MKAQENKEDLLKREAAKKKMLEEVTDAVLIGRYTDYYMAENVKEYFRHVSNKVENIVRTVDGKRVYHVVMPYLENRVTWMKFISALINRRMRWEIWEN